MSEDLFNTPAGSLIKTTLVDFPGLVACTVFLEGCNLHCPYCYNLELVIPQINRDNPYQRNYPFSTLNEIFAHLEKRQGILKGIVISGGEPLLNPRTPLLIKKAKELGYRIKLDTNGTLPELLKRLCENKELCPDYIAMDIKTNPENYSVLTSSKENKKLQDEHYFEALKTSCSYIAGLLPPQNREWRTVLVPSLVNENTIERIASILPEDAQWYFSQFRNESCISEQYSQIFPYTDSQISQLIEKARSLISGAVLR